MDSELYRSVTNISPDCPEGDVVRYLQSLREVPSCLVNNHNGMWLQVR